MLEVLYQDDHYIAINKPHGLLVHRSSIATNTDEYALQKLRDQIGRRVNPVHRLDRKTSGVLLFAYDQESTKRLHDLFSKGEITKKYLAIVRGHFPEYIEIDYALTNDRGKKQEARSIITNIQHTEINIPLGKWSTSRYSLVFVQPLTGRQHQIRKHLSHLNHPIIGDRPHGCNKQNRLFKEKWNMINMMLCATSLTFQHPYTQRKIKIQASVSDTFSLTANLLGINAASLEQ
ncbi:MAG: tRNA pseudouridine65 synthase [Saprospiraceae bacterium]|jgi:tRNA pseudouridine65 synthase